MPEDTRTCILCHKIGDDDPEVCSRLLNHDVDGWVHLNCALWSTEVSVVLVKQQLNGWLPGDLLLNKYLSVLLHNPIYWL